VRGGEHVHAADGDIGEVQGLVIDPGSYHVTHVLLQEGHVLGRKVVAIPIGAVTGVTQDGIQLNITKQQVKDLPSAYHRASAPPRECTFRPEPVKQSPFDRTCPPLGFGSYRV
jgi:hypothetical protein